MDDAEPTPDFAIVLAEPIPVKGPGSTCASRKDAGDCMCEWGKELNCRLWRGFIKLGLSLGKPTILRPSSLTYESSTQGTAII